jgi:hypothetical protein
VPAGGDQRSSDEVRLLARHSEYGYTDRSDLALPDEPEALSAFEQERLTQRARRDHEARRRAVWKETRAIVVPAIDAFAASVATDRALVHALRGVRRSLDAVSRQVA